MFYVFEEILNDDLKLKHNLSHQETNFLNNNFYI